MNSFETFLKLHHQANPLLIGNIWDVHSAILFEQCGYKAIGTSSAAVANTFGYEDGEQVPFDNIVRLAKRVINRVNIPVSIDMEGGYSRTTEGIYENIKKLYDVGVVGINLEDTIPGNEQKLQDIDAFKKILSSLCNLLNKNHVHVFLNIRTDSYLLGLPNALTETLARVAAYGECGIHGIFVPCITDLREIKEITCSTELPVSVMSMPALANFDALKSIGVKRISMGNALHKAVFAFAENKVRHIQTDRNFTALFSA